MRSLVPGRRLESCARPSSASSSRSTRLGSKPAACSDDESSSPTTTAAAARFFDVQVESLADQRTVFVLPRLVDLGGRDLVLESANASCRDFERHHEVV